MKPLILFITRNYPPKVGGLETYSYHLIRQFETNGRTLKITLGKSKVHLLWFLPFCFLKAAYWCWKHSVCAIHLCDGLLSPIGLVLRVATRARVSITVHGLDVTYRVPGYQRLIPACLRRLDLIVCVSRSTRDACLQRGIPDNKCHVIPNGIDPEALQLPADHEPLLGDLQDRCEFSFSGKKILLTVGRLVPRKGIAWFVQNVMPQLPTDMVYLIAGNGPEYLRIGRIIRNLRLEERVSLLGTISDLQRNTLLARADISVLPNIVTPGDMEGFGIAAIEAGAAGVPVVASNLEGIRDAVIDGVTGYLVAEKDSEAFRDKILGMDLDRRNIQAAVRSTFNWASVALRYRDLILYPQETEHGGGK
jgi:glycosyltransferase involved in cell wall biosynthesis